MYGVEFVRIYKRLSEFPFIMFYSQWFVRPNAVLRE